MVAEPSRTRCRACLDSACLALLYFASAKIGLVYAVVGGAISLVWPPSGIALVAVLAFGKRVSPGIAAGSFLANVSADVPLPAAAGIATGATLAALAAAHLLQHQARFQIALNRTRDVLALILLAAILGTTISAFVGVTSLVAGGLVPLPGFASAWLKWWLGDMIGVLVVAPPLLVWLSHPHPIASTRKAVEAAGLVAALGCVSYLIFGAPELAGHGYYPAALAIVPFIIWAALRFDHWGASLAILAVSIVAIWGTTGGTGPLAADSPVDSLVRWSTFVNLLAVTGLLLVASHAETQRAQTELRASHAELERRVRERTASLARTNAELREEMTARRRLERKLVRVGDEQLKATGRELHDGLGQHLTSIGLYGATLEHKLRAQGHPEACDAERIVTLVKQAVAMIQAIARGLYPAALESAGLVAALRNLAESTHSLKKIDCVLRSAPELQLRDSLVVINLYRIAQEAINNALKYSQARHIWIDLSCSDGMLTLSVSDDGIGIDPASADRSEGLGLHNMRHRANLLGGSCAIDRNAHGGTTVAISYPVAEASAS
ncbi:MASE1 domain-containing protein [Aromatoleum diolicum]|uniref:histidine kinase n=1 Tax=Aromatoleum diolicum TaxID=75796 RepID=A0ABX1QAJ2_9RHOO|nr:MASE1 domain-containing protein [Aromatoleum diolicum]NMG75384.1 sensor histidine kinase [Aromatoleum diolicum]